MRKILKTKSYILFLFFIVINSSLFSQGLVENTLSCNQVLINKWNELKIKTQASAAGKLMENGGNSYLHTSDYQLLREASIYDTISLDSVKGFLDDFSNDGSFPDTTFWLDNQAFINRGYAKAPITIGVATFDGLNTQGYPYSFLVSPTSSSSADSLTSKPINLLNYINSGVSVNYQLSDSIYFSFYYQPQGLGNAPDLNDSLVLEFIAPGITSWQHIWSEKGSILASNDSSWKLVMIPINDIQYFKKGFQFRFRNYATVSGNLDHWHIDYVYLNKNRTLADTIFEDVSFVYNTPSLLTTYSEMPWKHYDPTFMKTSYSNTIRNNYTNPKNGSFLYKVYDASGLQLNTTYSGGNANLDPFILSGFVNEPPFTTPVLNYTIPALTDTTSYIIESVLFSSPDKERNNDTVRHRQKFYNSYSYDDGTAETAFGLSTLNAQMAEKFVSTIADTLRCIDIYFNPLLTNANLYAFSLNVWDDNGGTPGTAIYTSDSVLRPMYAQTGQDQFTHYYLNPPLYINAGTFYIGFTQKTTEFLNVGVDKNTNTQDKIFYNVSGSWNNSPFPGSLMMHPVFGIADYYLGIDSPTSKSYTTFTVFPNPANDKLYINSNSGSVSEKISYSIIDLYGRMVSESMFDSSHIDISELAEGVYFIRIIEGTQVSTTKFIKVK